MEKEAKNLNNQKSASGPSVEQPASPDQQSTVSEVPASATTPDAQMVSAPVGKKKSSKGLMLLIVFLMLALAGLGGWFVWQNYMTTTSATPPVMEKVVPTTTVAPTPTASLEEQELNNLDLNDASTSAEFDKIQKDIGQL